MQKNIKTEFEMQKLGGWLAKQLPSDFCLELIGDIGAGKTTLVRGLVGALSTTELVTSPSFTINNRYQINDRLISHYDFYRLADAGLIKDSLIEDLADPKIGVIIEWGQTVDDVLPKNRLVIKINYLKGNQRAVEITGLTNES